jgi:hypothetical protein
VPSGGGEGTGRRIVFHKATGARAACTATTATPQETDMAGHDHHRGRQGRWFSASRGRRPFLNPAPAVLGAAGSRADHAGPVPLVRTGVWPQRCLSRGEATVPSRRAWSGMAAETVVPAAVTGKVAARNPANLTQAVRDAMRLPVYPGAS